MAFKARVANAVSLTSTGRDCCKLRGHAGSRRACAASTHFKQKLRGAWKHARGGLPCQIGHTLVSREHKLLTAGHSAVSLRTRRAPFIGKRAPERDERKAKGGFVIALLPSNRSFSRDERHSDSDSEFGWFCRWRLTVARGCFVCEN